MTDPNEWINELIPPEQIEQIQAQSKRIVEAEGTFYEMSIMMAQADMMDAVRASYGMRMGDKESWIIGIGVLMALMSTMEIALDKDGIDIWKD
jgi:hypothetical protein